MMDQLEGQMSIFDFLEVPNDLPALYDVIELVSGKFGLDFKKEVWEFMNGKVVYVHEFGKKSRLEIYESEYSFGDHKRYISVNWSYNLGGFGCPCDSADEVIRCVEMAIKREKERAMEYDKKIGRGNVLQESESVEWESEGCESDCYSFA